jgi:transcription antitermination factor NusG
MDKRRLHLDISIFGRVTPIDLEFFEVEKVE